MSDPVPVGGWPDAPESPELLAARARTETAVAALRAQAGTAAIPKSQRDSLLAELARFRDLETAKSDPDHAPTGGPKPEGT